MLRKHDRYLRLELMFRIHGRRTLLLLYSCGRSLATAVQSNTRLRCIQSRPCTRGLTMVLGPPLQTQLRWHQDTFQRC